MIAIVEFLIGWLGKKDWTALDARLASIFPITVDIQLLLGLLLYFVLSPITTGALRDFGAAMKNSVVRYYSVEHIFMMLIALIVAHIGSMMIKKRTDATAKFRIGFILFLLAMIILFLAIPWPFLTADRAGRGDGWGKRCLLTPAVETHDHRSHHRGGDLPLRGRAAIVAFPCARSPRRWASRRARPLCHFHDGLLPGDPGGRSGHHGKDRLRSRPRDISAHRHVARVIPGDPLAANRPRHHPARQPGNHHVGPGRPVRLEGALYRGVRRPDRRRCCSSLSSGRADAINTRLATSLLLGMAYSFTTTTNFR